MQDPLVPTPWPPAVSGHCLRSNHIYCRYDIDILEEAAVLKWYAQAPEPKDGAGRKVRKAAAPFIKWLREADEESSGEEEDGEEEDGEQMHYAS